MTNEKYMYSEIDHETFNPITQFLQFVLATNAVAHFHRSS